MIFRDPSTIHSPLAGYSHQAEVAGDARWLIVSAQIGMTTPYVSALASPALKVEIEAYACKPR